MLELSLRERIETALVRAVTRIPPTAIRSVLGPPTERDGRTLDPQVQLVIRLHTLVGKEGPHAVPLAVARRDLDVAAGQLARRPPPSLASVTSAVVGGRPARIYEPHGVTKPAPAVVYYHGGGFVLGSLESHDGACREMAATLPAVVVAVDYRLAPEAPFPAAVDDATAALRDVLARAEALGLDPGRVGVAGDSAGGNLACEASLETRGDVRRPRATLAVYPAVDFTLSFPSHRTLGEGFFLEERNILFYRKTYLAGTDPKHPRASPWFAEDVRGLPPQVVVTAGFDPLRDEGDAWAERLREAGVEVDHLTFPGLFHGFWNTTGRIAAAADAFEEAVSAFRRCLGVR